MKDDNTGEHRPILGKILRIGYCCMSKRFFSLGLFLGKI
jgi:hypothetical protein